MVNLHVTISQGDRNNALIYSKLKIIDAKVLAQSFRSGLSSLL